jgi:hypothetical protein
MESEERQKGERKIKLTNNVPGYERVREKKEREREKTKKENLDRNGKADVQYNNVKIEFIGKNKFDEFQPLVR